MSKLYVNEVHSKTGSTKALEIDSDGIVTQPAKPSFYAYSDDGWTGLTANTYTLAPLDHTNFNVGSCYNTSTKKFVAPIAGIYFFHGQGYFDPTGRLRLRFTKNGSEIAFAHANFDGGGTTHSLSKTLELSANDEIQFYVRADSGTDGSADVYYGENHTFFTGFLVG